MSNANNVTKKYPWEKYIILKILSKFNILISFEKLNWK